MNDNGRRVSDPIPSFMTTPGGRVIVWARLTYDLSDPFAVQIMTWDQAGGSRQVWTVGRDLLLAGLTASAACPAGLDRIRVWTFLSPGNLSLLRARMPDSSILEMCHADVADFLQRTTTVVYPGDEALLCDVDAEFIRLVT
jgi:Streptomyces sporulation and cell division protein, SsgA